MFCDLVLFSLDEITMKVWSSQVHERLSPNNVMVNSIEQVKNAGKSTGSKSGENVRGAVMKNYHFYKQLSVSNSLMTF